MCPLSHKPLGFLLLAFTSSLFLLYDMCFHYDACLMPLTRAVPDVTPGIQWCANSPWPGPAAPGHSASIQTESSCCQPRLKLVVPLRKFVRKLGSEHSGTDSAGNSSVPRFSLCDDRARLVCVSFWEGCLSSLYSGSPAGRGCLLPTGADSCC